MTRSLEDQANAMVQGYVSTNEWAIAEIIKKVQDLEARVAKLEGVDVVEYDEPDPED